MRTWSATWCAVAVSPSAGELLPPGKSPSQPFSDERAKQGLAFAVEHDADFVALSSITGAENVKAARELLKEGDPDPFIISKIERPEALENFDDILAASDGIMVARGDMGGRGPLAQVPVIQKDLIARSNLQGTPVITATQMLESMVNSPVPNKGRGDRCRQRRIRRHRRGDALRRNLRRDDTPPRPSRSWQR